MLGNGKLGKVVRKKTELSLPEALEKAWEQVISVKKTELLAGLGDLLGSKQKAFIKEKLQDDLWFFLKLYVQNAVSK